LHRFLSKGAVAVSQKFAVVNLGGRT